MRQADELMRRDSCINRAMREEMVFVLLGRDKAAPWAIRFWCLLRVLTRKNRWKDEKIKEALSAAEIMQRERKERTK